MPARLCSVDFNMLEGSLLEGGAATTTTSRATSGTRARPAATGARCSSSGTPAKHGAASATVDADAHVHGLHSDDDGEAGGGALGVQARELADACKQFFRMCRADEAPIYLLLQVGVALAGAGRL